MLKFSEKIFLQKSRNDSVAVVCGKGGAPNTIMQQNNIGAKRTYRAYIIRAYCMKTAFLLFWGV